MLPSDPENIFEHDDDAVLRLVQHLQRLVEDVIANNGAMTSVLTDLVATHETLLTTVETHFSGEDALLGESAAALRGQAQQARRQAARLRARAAEIAARSAELQQTDGVDGTEPVTG